MPGGQLLTEMDKFNDKLVKAGVMLAGEGLQPSSKGARVRFSGSKRTVVHGPFAEAGELVAGFWLLQVKSKEEAIEYAERHGIAFRLHEPNDPPVIIKAYADNFATNRKQSWTH